MLNVDLKHELGGRLGGSFSRDEEFTNKHSGIMGISWDCEDGISSTRSKSSPNV